MLEVLCKITEISKLKKKGGGSYYCSHFTDEETKAQIKQFSQVTKLGVKARVKFALYDFKPHAVFSSACSTSVEKGHCPWTRESPDKLNA